MVSNDNNVYGWTKATINQTEIEHYPVDWIENRANNITHLV